jgi:hypothetical protein
MNFPKSANIDGILAFIRPTIEQVLNSAKYGVTVDVRPQVRKRSLEQNSYLWGIYSNIVKFWEQTGFMPDGLKLNYINSNFLHEYFKARFDIKTTTKLTTAEFCEYTDKIQHLMTEQSKGNYDPIYPDQPLQEI